MSDPRTKLVGEGYDARADAWEEWVVQIADDPRQEWAADFAARLEPGARVLELGCGNGTRETKELAERFTLTGVDLSEKQLERARKRVPGATFLRDDLTTVEFLPGSFDAVVAFYVFNHVPRELLAPLLGRIATWLTPGGLMMSVFGASDLPEWTGEWLGAPTYFSGFEPAENSRLVTEAGFTIVRDKVVTITEPEGPVSFQWIMAHT